MTNYEKIKSLSLDEIAKKVCDSYDNCNNCPFFSDCESERDGVTKWLNHEAKNSDLSEPGEVGGEKCQV